MLDLARPVTLAPFDPRTIDDLSDAELDALAFGVIALDEEGTVLRYNLYESRLARLDRNQVVGRNFFDDVAPCTRIEAFQGRFRAFAARAIGIGWSFSLKVANSLATSIAQSNTISLTRPDWAAFRRARSKTFSNIRGTPINMVGHTSFRLSGTLSIDSAK